MKLDGFGIAGFRSFGSDLVRIPDLAKVNVFIGKNNSGKSNILNFCEHLSKMPFGRMEYNGLNKQLDYCVDSDKRQIRFAIQVKKDSSATGDIYKEIENILPNLQLNFPDWRSSIWFEYDVWDRGKDLTLVSPCVNQLSHIIQPKVGGEETRSKDLARSITNLIKLNFEVRKIGAFRRITGEPSGQILEGKGLINELRKIQSPELGRYHPSKEKFRKIKDFLRELLSEDEVFFEIPAELDEVLVSIKGKILPLSSLGTGIHELIILASAVTIFEDCVFCIEEPEIHIHPELQKKLIRYLQSNTNNQYLISSHSNASFDVPGVNIYHCRLVNGHTTCELVATDYERGGVLADLGYKPSDLLQTNFVIWVEGPSDRVYLNHWIRGKDSALVEGLHYSIMFYGGRLLSHLAYDNPEVSEFIQLSRLNRNAAIIIDSDRQSAHSQINRTKKRVIQDFKSNECFAWVTNGREIENYIPADIWNDCVKQVHPKEKGNIPWERFGEMTCLANGNSIDKVVVARKVARRNPDYSVLDLNKQINTLIECIHKANK